MSAYEFNLSVFVQQGLEDARNSNSVFEVAENLAKPENALLFV
jgi:hypothetical protein